MSSNGSCNDGSHIYRSVDGVRTWYTKAGIKVTDATEIAALELALAEDPNCDNVTAAANTHVIEGCILVNGSKADGYTVIDDTGAALFSPKPLSDLGFVDCCDDSTASSASYEVSFKSSGIQQIVTDCGTWDGNYDFQSPLDAPQSSDDAGSQMQQAKNSIDAWLASNGGGTVRLEYLSQSILTVTISGSSCVAQTANDDSNPGPHAFSEV